MSDDTNEPNDTQHPMHPTHFIVCPEILPADDATREEWERRAVMCADMAEQLAGTLYVWMRINVPMLADQSQLPAQLIAAVGVLARGIRDSGRIQLRKAGIEPLNVEDDQANLMRDKLADPTTTPEQREFYLEALAHRLSCDDAPPRESSPREAANAPEEEWPNEIGEG